MTGAPHPGPGGRGPRVLDAQEAAALIEDGWTVASAGFVGAGHAETVTRAIEARFHASGRPRGLTLVFSGGQGDRSHRGVNHFWPTGMLRRAIGGHWRSATRLARAALENRFEAFNLPQGVITHLYRAIAAGQPGVLTRIGLDTFVDPALDGGRVNGARDPALPPPVERVEFDGRPMLLYRAFPIHCALLRATSADPSGNLSCEREAFHHELLAIAQAARNSGGLVIAQVERRVARHERLADVRVPGILVDVVVVCEPSRLADDHSMTFGERFNPDYVSPAGSGEATPPASDDAAAAATAIRRRAALELARARPRVVNLGVGMPAAVGAIARDAGLDGFTLSVEAGPIGGVPADGLSFGASAFPECVIDEPAQFDFYDGGGIDVAVLGFGEFDGQGNVNVSRFGDGAATVLAGVGGFVNITQSARRIVFVGTLTAGGLETAFEGDRLRILREGRHRKAVGRVGQVSFSGPRAAREGVPVTWVTERAVFRLDADGPVLTEIAPGLDPWRDVAPVLAFPLRLAPQVHPMPASLWRAGRWTPSPDELSGPPATAV